MLKVDFTGKKIQDIGYPDSFKEDFMSNHSVGHAINEVTRGVYTTHLKGNLTKTQTKDLIDLCHRCSTYEDGNAHEGVECLKECVCGVCLDVIEEGVNLYSCYAEIKGEVSCNAWICEHCLAEAIASDTIVTSGIYEAIDAYPLPSVGYFLGSDHVKYTGTGNHSIDDSQHALIQKYFRID